MAKFKYLNEKYTIDNYIIQIFMLNLKFEFFSVFFVAGKRLYVIKNPAGNVLVKVSSCIGVST